MSRKMVASDLIGDIRHRSDLTQAELGRRAGMPRSVVNAYGRGNREPGVDALARIAAAANLKLEIAPVASPVDPERAGRLLAQVLDLAEALPHKRRGSLSYPPLTRLSG
jgi:transcriptional regulator with XRE-family HTH domain